MPEGRPVLGVSAIVYGVVLRGAADRDPPSRGAVSFHCREIVAGENAAGNLQELWSEVLVDLSYRWTVDTLAERSGMGREALRMKCVAATGRSPMKHLNHLRMQHARHLLLDLDLTLDEVAEAVGYATAFSFSKAFLAHTGTRPSTYRQKTPVRLGNGSHYTTKI